MKDPGPDVTQGEGDEPGDAPPRRESFYEQPVWKRFYAFVLGPALLAAVALAVFTAISVLTAEDSSPDELVQALKAGGRHRRWQAAFALTKYLQPSMGQDERPHLDADYRERVGSVRRLVPELLEIYEDSDKGDTEVKRFLALAFSYLGDPRPVSALARSLTAEDTELVHYALAAIAKTSEHPTGREALTDEAMMAVLSASRRPEHDIRATSVLVLGVWSAPPAIQRLEDSVHDEAPAVRWNAAFALAQNDNAGGEKIIVEILDRGPLYHAAGPDPVRQADLFLNAVRSAGMLRTPALQERLSRIAKSDENLRARDMAIKLLEET